jgi:hypothetical protein
MDHLPRQTSLAILRHHRKYDPGDKYQFEKGSGDPVKAESKPAYARMKADWKEKFG